MPPSTPHLHADDFFACFPRHFSSTLTPFFWVQPSNFRLHIDAIFCLLPLHFSRTLKLFSGCHPKYFSCTLTQFFGSHPGHFMRTLTPFFDLTCSKSRPHIDTNFWKPHSKRRLHTYSMFGCHPGEFLSTLTFFWVPPSNLRLHPDDILLLPAS